MKDTDVKILSSFHSSLERTMAIRSIARRIVHSAEVRKLQDIPKDTQNERLVLTVPHGATVHRPAGWQEPQCWIQSCD
jgi:hypothetical protein